MSASEADVAGAQAAIAAAQKQADAARAQLQAAEANNTRAQADLVRYRELLAKDEVSQQIYDQSDAAAKANAATVESARADVAAAEQQVTQAQSRVAQAQAALAYSHTGPQQVEATRARARAAAAQVQQKKAALDQAELNLQYCTLIAPVSGVVSKNVEVGMNVQPGQTLVSIVPLDDVWVTANFKETQLAKMRPGQRVTISVDAFSREYHGNVDSIAGASGARFSLLAAGKCHRQLRESRAARAGQDRARSGREQRSSCCAWECPWCRRCTCNERGRHSGASGRARLRRRRPSIRGSSR